MIQIDVLPDDVLLGIFKFYVDSLKKTENRVVGTEGWQSLVHVCRRWRSIVFESPHRLDLQLVCTWGTRTRDGLDIWPALPLMIIAWDPMTSSGADNVITALGQTNRVRAVNMFCSWCLFEEVLAVMDVSFPELTDLRLSVFGSSPAIPDTFLGGSAPPHRSPFASTDIDAH